MKSDNIQSNLRKYFDSMVIDVLQSAGKVRLPPPLTFGVLFQEVEDRDIHIDDWEAFIRGKLAM